MIVAARTSTNPFDFALVAVLGLLGLRLFEACNADVDDLGEEHGRRSELHLDRELPADLPCEDEIDGMKSRRTIVVDLARRERLTVRQLISRLGGGRGHFTVAGNPEHVAEVIAHWYDSRAADGFNVMPPVLPSGLSSFVD
jgi:alkanesulfonate monooxygenase SsuD/methylene tetrahydromethanopterin reductase-like flavin-dependent oxidoreductase (luciferase family)